MNSSSPRLTNTGALDTTFGSQGRTIVNVDRGGVTSQVIASDVVVAPDGRITLAGSWTANGAVSPDASDNNTFVLARLTSAGNVDVTFDGDGRQYLRGPIVVGADGSGLDMDRLPDGRLVLAGTLGTNSSIGDGVIIRLNPDGSTDTSLDGDGVLMLPPTAGTLERPFAVETDSAGRITVAIAQGSLGVVSTNNATLIRRFNSSGTVDNTFQTNTQKVSGTAYTTDLSLTDDGSILLTNSAGVTAVSADGKTSGTFYSPPTVPPTSPPTGSPISPPPIQAPNANNLPSGLGTATADMTGDGIADVVQVVNTNQLRVIDGKSGKTIIDNHQPFGESLQGAFRSRLVTSIAMGSPRWSFRRTMAEAGA